ncbi:MAG: hypothetical protein Q7T25_04210 [Sideroxyarcus sp.]|nr:hypothetical protein [Sideroxyarcus sp.]
MKIASLSTDQSPPISIPLSFFALAPLFLVLAAVMLALDGDNPFADTHAPAMLAATHCITLGFMASVMFGAAQQILPVLVGSKMPASRLVAWCSLLPLILGVLSLCAGFILGKPTWLNLAWPLLGVAFLTFISASLVSLAHAAVRNNTRTAILLSIISLSLAVTLGVLLARGYATGASLPYAELATAHIKLSLGGWVMLLIVGVSYQVVPMFQLTPNYPKWLSAALAPAIFTVLMSTAALLMVEPYPHRIAVFAECLFWLLAICFAIVTLILQQQRRRSVPDATLNFFRLGMFSLLFAALFSLASLLYPPADTCLRTLSVLAFLLGFAMSVTIGMLYKIIPFLIWFHLFRGGMKSGVPNMKQIIPETWMWGHYRLQLGTLLAATCAPFWNTAAWAVMLGLLLQGLLLATAVFTAIAVYRKNARRINLAKA